MNLAEKILKATESLSGSSLKDHMQIINDRLTNLHAATASGASLATKLKMHDKTNGTDTAKLLSDFVKKQGEANKAFLDLKAAIEK